MAAILAVVVIGALVFATHSATPPAKAAVVLPHCTKIKKANGQSDQQDSAVSRNGILAKCGPGWAAFKVAGSWHLIPAGHCKYGLVPTTGFYAGLFTARRVPHVGLHLYIKLKVRNPTPGREYRATGYVEMVPGAIEHLAGSVIWTSAGDVATFRMLGSRTHHVYAGVWSCFDPTS